MTTNNPNASVNQWPLLSEDMERTLRRLAWKDEDFREALVADPKGVIQQVFHQYLPNGTLPDNLTIKVIEQDPFTHHIVLPPLADEVPILEIAEEEQLDLIVNMGELSWKHESNLPNESTDKKKYDFIKEHYDRKPSWGGVENIDDAFPKKDAKFPTKDEYEKARPLIIKDQQLLKMLRTNPTEGARLLFDRYFPGRKMPGGVDFQVLQNTADTHHIVLRSPNASQNIEALEEKQLDRLAKMNFEDCKTKSNHFSSRGACGSHNCTDSCNPPCTNNCY